MVTTGADGSRLAWLCLAMVTKQGCSIQTVLIVVLNSKVYLLEYITPLSCNNMYKILL
jgi:hypothetical protein